MTIQLDPAAIGRQAVASGLFRTLRQRAGMSIEEAAAMLGVHYATVLRWEQGRVPYPRHARLIAEVLPAMERMANAIDRRPR